MRAAVQQPAGEPRLRLPPQQSSRNPCRLRGVARHALVRCARASQPRACCHSLKYTHAPVLPPDLMQELVLGRYLGASLPQLRGGALQQLTRLRIAGSRGLQQIHPSWCALPALLVSGPAGGVLRCAPLRRAAAMRPGPLRAAHVCSAACPHSHTMAVGPPFAGGRALRWSRASACGACPMSSRPSPACSASASGGPCVRAHGVTAL